MKMPYVADAHVGFRVRQSKQTFFLCGHGSVCPEKKFVSIAYSSASGQCAGTGVGVGMAVERTI